MERGAPQPHRDDDGAAGLAPEEVRSAERGAIPDRLAASYLTHELKAPLTAIQAALDLLKSRLDGTLERNYAQALDLARKNTARLESLINDILDYSKVQSGKLTLRRSAQHSRSLLRDAVESLNPWAISKGIKVVQEEEPRPLPRVLADPIRTVQVLTNLLSNAIKYTSPGGRVCVSARPGRGEHAGTMVFSVRDNGRGIASEDLERVFDLFEQAAAGRKRSDGAGLGLTLARAMVELQRGRIWAESWQGVGSAFRFTLPLYAPDLARPVEPYPEPVEVQGLLADLARRLNAWLTYFA